MGGIAWFAVPLTFSSIMGLAAVALAKSEVNAYIQNRNYLMTF